MQSAPAPAGGRARSGRPTSSWCVWLWGQPLGVAEQLTKVPARQPALDSRRRPHAHAPELDEAGGSRLVELVALAIRGQRALIQLPRSLAADDLRPALVELEADLARDVT